MTDSTVVTDTGLGHLKALRNLRELILFGPSLTDEARKQVEGALPDCPIRFSPDW